MMIFGKARRPAGLAAGLSAVALLVAACGSSATTSSTSSPTSTASAAASSSVASTTASQAAATGASIGTAKSPAGTYLTGASGRAVYLWMADSAGKSSCSGACAKVWPPVTSAGKPAAAAGANAADLGTITRADGTKQVTYKSHPLYYFVGDAHAGTTTGQGSDGFGAKWWLVSPTGAAITAAHSSAGASSSSSSSSGY